MTFKIVVTYDWLMVNNILLFIYLILKNYQRNLHTHQMEISGGIVGLNLHPNIFDIYKSVFLFFW
jgi:hypothetical protein